MRSSRGLWFLALPVLGACGSQNCTVVGATSEVGLTMPSSLWTVETFCVEGDCIEPPSRASSFIWVQVDDDPASYDVRAVVVSPSGDRFSFDGVVRTTEFRINGPGCEPVTASGGLVVSEDGTFAGGEPAT